MATVTRSAQQSYSWRYSASHPGILVRASPTTSVRAASAAVAAPLAGGKVQATGGALRQYNQVDARQQAPEVERDLTTGGASSGMDFIDLVGLDDGIVLDRRQDAVTYCVLVGRGRNPARTSGPEPFNLKQVVSFRDNVTRNLAPTVARGFANAARAAGHVIAAAPSRQPAHHHKPHQPKPQHASNRQAHSAAVSSNGPRQERHSAVAAPDIGPAPAAPVSVAVAVTCQAQATVLAAATGPAAPHPTKTLVGSAASLHVHMTSGPARAFAHHVAASPHTAAAVAACDGKSFGPVAEGADGRPVSAGTDMKCWSEGSTAAVAVAPGRRWGGRSAGRDMLAGAGRQGQATSPAWI